MKLNEQELVDIRYALAEVIEHSEQDTPREEVLLKKITAEIRKIRRGA